MVTNIISGASESSITIFYSKGVTVGSDINKSGIHYVEKYGYQHGLKEEVSIDGVYLAELYYNKITYDENKISVGDDDYKLMRLVNLASIVGMEIGTQWTNNGAIEAFLITKSGLNSLYNEPKYSIDMIYNRGNASAWENYFKLSECNTMEDLKNYGNNFFNL
jgi:hypothetical protein